MGRRTWWLALAGYAAFMGVGAAGCSSTSSKSPTEDGGSGEENGGVGTAGSTRGGRGGSPAGNGGASSGAGGEPNVGGGDIGGSAGAPETPSAGAGPIETGGSGGSGGAETEPETNLPKCGDGARASSVEDCDDGNTDGGDGCSATCTVESGFACPDGEASTCTPICGDGITVGDEKKAGRCDDANGTSGDGCNDACKVEDGFKCGDQSPTVCLATCGDGLVVGAEARAGGCDDTNNLGGDGCSAGCTVEASFVCSGAPSACAKTCGNGALDAGEACDDRNSKAGDGCFACAVERGFTCTGVATCSDINECTAATDDCHANATCTNTAGSFTCACKSGYTGNGVSCQNVNECTSTTNPDNCAATATCTDTAGSFTCACNSGYTGNGVSCQNVNECTSTTTPDNCAATATCTDTAGSFTCACNGGYTGNGVTCQNINECTSTTTPDNCSANATCADTNGSFTCTCKSGFSGNGVTCNDNNECSSNPCKTNETCTNTPGSYTCACKTGYTLLSGACVPVLQAITGTVRTISRDGTVVAGSAKAGTTFRESPMRWTLAGGTEFLKSGSTALVVEQGSVNDANADGTVLVGQVLFASGTGGAFHFTSQASGMVLLNYGTSSVAQAVSANGAIIAGYRSATSDTNAFRLTGTTGTAADLGPIITLYGMSDNGGTILGLRGTGGGGGEQVRWTSSTGFVALPDQLYIPTAISGDGGTIIGYYSAASSEKAFRYTASTDYEDMPLGSWLGTRATALSTNGSIIVGTGPQGSWIWDATNGVRLLTNIATSRGADLTGWTSQSPTAISGDGSVVVGTGYLNNVWTSWILRLK